MNGDSITYLSMISLVVFMIPMFYINNRLNMRINTKLMYAIARMVIQLSLVGVFLQYVFNLNNGFLNILYVIMMIVIASFSAINSCKLDLKIFIAPLFMAFVIPTIVVLLYFNFFVIRLDNIFNAQFIIPIGGMILGNSLGGNIICINNFYHAIKSDEKTYLYSLSLSGSKKEALKPYFRDAVLSSISPTMASIETIGLVALPGMMTGQILGGAIPITAIKYQIAIMLAILISRYFSAILSILITSVSVFDDFDMLTIKFKQ